MEEFRRQYLKSQQNIQYNPQTSDQIGPVKPSQKLLQDQDSSSEEDLNTLKNDPIYLQSHSLQKKQEDEEQPTNKRSRSNSQEDDQVDKRLDQLGIPCTYEVNITGSERLVTTIAIDRTATRFSTGSYDYNMRMYDFSGMNKNMNAFRILEPIESQPIKRLSYSKDSSKILTIVQGKQVKMVDRDGRIGNISIKGDMYITDMSKTKGHTQEVNDGMFSNTELNWFVTCSQDSTVRLWDINQRLVGLEQQMAQTFLIKCIDAKGQRTPVKTIQYSHDGQLVFAGCGDGSIQAFSVKKDFHRAQYLVRSAHQNGQDITSLQLFGDDIKLVSRSLDNSVKIWDIRNFKKPIEAIYNQQSSLPGARVCISANQKYICVPTYDVQKSESFLHFYSSDTFQEKAKLFLGDYNITDIQWNSRLNQIFIAMGNTVRIFFDPNISQMGALLCVNKQPRKQQLEDQWDGIRKIFVPNALSMFHDIPDWKKKQIEEEEKLEQDIKSYGPGKQGNPGGVSTSTQFIMKMINALPDTRDDPQQALIRLAKEAEEHPDLIDNAYKETQPKRIYYEDAPQIEEQQFLSQIKTICPQCGLKLCTCSKRIEFEYKKAIETDSRKPKK